MSNKVSSVDYLCCNWTGMKERAQVIQLSAISREFSETCLCLADWTRSGAVEAVCIQIATLRPATLSSLLHGSLLANLLLRPQIYLLSTPWYKTGLCYRIIRVLILQLFLIIVLLSRVFFGLRLSYNQNTTIKASVHDKPYS